VKEFLKFWLIYVTLRLKIPVCFHKLYSESQQNRIKYRTLYLHFSKILVSFQYGLFCYSEGKFITEVLFSISEL
jgi:hypothetical protein